MTKVINGCNYIRIPELFQEMDMILERGAKGDKTCFVVLWQESGLEFTTSLLWALHHSSSLDYEGRDQSLCEL